MVYETGESRATWWYDPPSFTEGCVYFQKWFGFHIFVLMTIVLPGGMLYFTNFIDAEGPEGQPVLKEIAKYWLTRPHFMVLQKKEIYSWYKLKMYCVSVELCEMKASIHKCELSPPYFPLFCSSLYQLLSDVVDLKPCMKDGKDREMNITTEWLLKITGFQLLKITGDALAYHTSGHAPVRCHCRHCILC